MLIRFQEQYGRAKETHSHTQALWEKEIRRARKETFKTQSTHVKLQEDLKTARSAVKILEETVEREKERCQAREQEAFEARYELVGVQEHLEQALERIKVIEQERDAFKTAAKNEEVARIAAEGRIPLPKASSPHDEFASPPKKSQKKRKISGDPRYSLSTFEIESSAAMEMEVEELEDQVQWEKRRADRALEMVDFLQAECENSWCACGRKKQRTSLGPSPRHASVVHHPVAEVEEPVDEDMEEEEGTPEDSEEDIPAKSVIEAPLESHDNIPSPVASPKLNPQLTIAPPEPTFESLNAGIPAPKSPQSKKEPRRSTIFCPEEGIFRTVSEQEAMALQADDEAEIVVEEAQEQESEAESGPPTPVGPQMEIDEPEEETEEPEMEVETHRRMYARTPSVEPPSFALLGQQRTSLLSLLNAPLSGGYEAPLPKVPTIRNVAEESYRSGTYHDAPEEREQTLEQDEPEQPELEEETPEQQEPEPELPSYDLDERPHTSATLYGSRTSTVTTKVPIRDEELQRSSTASFNEKLRTPSNSSNASFDTKNPALTPTMTREEALAKIRERRGRARSAANGAATPNKKMIQGKDRRDMSAPTGKVGKARP